MGQRLVRSGSGAQARGRAGELLHDSGPAARRLFVPAHEPRAPGPARTSARTSRGDGQLLGHEAPGQALADPLAGDPDLCRPRAGRRGCGWRGPPRPSESPRSSLRPGISARFFSLALGHELHHFLEALARQQVAVEPRHRVVAGAPVDLGQVAQGASRAHQAARPAPGAPPPPPREARARDRVRRRTSPAVGGSDFRKASERRREPRGRLTAMRDPPLAEAGHLHAAAAHVEEDPVLHGKPAHRSQEAVARLLFAAQDAYVEAQALLDLGDELRAVLGVAHGGGGQGEDARRPPRPGRWPGSPGGPPRPAPGPRRKGDGSRPARAPAAASPGCWPGSAWRRPPRGGRPRCAPELQPTSMTATGPVAMSLRLRQKKEEPPGKVRPGGNDAGEGLLREDPHLEGHRRSS